MLPQQVLAQQFPELTGRVTDAAEIIPADVEARLTQKLEALETQSQRQLVIATLPSLEGYEISDYGYRLGRQWGLGGKERNDGILLIIAPNERKLRIEVGYGLEPIVTDGLSWMIINNEIVPRFKQGDMPAGIEAGADAIIQQLTLPLDQAMQIAAQAQKPRQEAGLPNIIFILFILFFFVLPVLRSMFGTRGGRRYRGSSSGPIIWSSGWGGGSSGGFGGGGFGGGGFSGGGGSFGGGGASGGW